MVSSFLAAFSSFVAIGCKINLNQMDNSYFFLYIIFLVCLPLGLLTLRLIINFSNKILFEDAKVEIDPSTKTITVTSKDDRGNVLTTINKIAYKKEKKKYFILGREWGRFFYVPKAGMKKDDIKTIRAIKPLKVEKYHQ